MKTIFMTGGGGAGTIAATKALRKLGKYRIVLGDMDKWAAGLKFADKAYILPAGKDDRFVGAIRNIISKERVDIFVPLVDEEILKSYELKRYFPNLLLLLPEYDFAKIALDKWLLIQKLKECSLPYPETRLATEGSGTIEYPLIVKPRIGRGSKNMMELKSENQIEAYKQLSDLSGNEILIQEKIKGKEYTVSAVINGNGDLLSVIPKEVIYKRGITVTAVTRKNTGISELCTEIQKKLKPNGPFNVQLILRDDGVPVIFEINPRFSTTIALTMASGVNEIDAIVQNQAYSGDPFEFEENLVMTRYHDQLYFGEQ